MNVFAKRFRSESASKKILIVFILTALFFSLLNSCVVFFALRQFEFEPSWGQFKLIVFLNFLYFALSYAYYLKRYNDPLYVSEGLGAKLASDILDSERKKILLNVVDEMCVASLQRRPLIYILPNEKIWSLSIANDQLGNMITLTKGALDQLNRDELQVLIAFEMGRILNRDSEYNAELSSVVSVFSKIYVLGKSFSQSDQDFLDSDLISSNHWRYRSRGGFYFLGFLLASIGYLGYLVTKLIKKLFFKKRTEAAKYWAIQLTRNSEALDSCLAKISNLNSSILEKSSYLFEHFFDHFFLDSLVSHENKIQNENVIRTSGTDVPKMKSWLEINVKNEFDAKKIIFSILAFESNRKQDLLQAVGFHYAKDSIFVQMSRLDLVSQIQCFNYAIQFLKTGNQIDSLFLEKVLEIINCDNRINFKEIIYFSIIKISATKKNIPKNKNLDSKAHLLEALNFVSWFLLEENKSKMKRSDQVYFSLYFGPIVKDLRLNSSIEIISDQFNRMKFLRDTDKNKISGLLDHTLRLGWLVNKDHLQMICLVSGIRIPTIVRNSQGVCIEKNKA
jgi:Zn-dependent protease with chaperone function